MLNHQPVQKGQSSHEDMFYQPAMYFADERREHRALALWNKFYGHIIYPKPFLPSYGSQRYQLPISMMRISQLTKHS